MDLHFGVAEVILLAAGLISLLLVIAYRKDKESGKYKALMVLGFLIGIAVVAAGALYYKEWSTFDAALIFIAAFALVIRPFRKVEIAIIAAVIVMIATYLYLGTLTGDWAVLAEGYPGSSSQSSLVHSYTWSSTSSRSSRICWESSSTCGPFLPFWVLSVS